MTQIFFWAIFIYNICHSLIFIWFSNQSLTNFDLNTKKISDDSPNTDHYNFNSDRKAHEKCMKKP